MAAVIEMVRGASLAKVWPSNSRQSAGTSPVTLQEYSIAAVYGLLTGLMELPVLFGFASIIFSDKAMQPHLPILNKFYHFSGVAYGLAFMLFDRLPWTCANAQDTPTIFLTTATGIILSRMGARDDEADEADERTLATVLTTITLGTLMCGVVFGLFVLFPKLTALVHYIPSPVLSGFLASVGLFLISGGFALAVPDFKDWPDIGQLGDMSDAHNFIPSLLYGVFVLVVNSTAKNPLANAAAMLFAVPAFYIVVAIIGFSEADMRDRNMLLEVDYGISPVDAWEAMDPSKVDWSAVNATVPELLKLAFLFPLLMLLNSVALESKFDTDIDWERELRVFAGANMLAGLGGGLAGGRLMSHTLLIYQSIPELRTKLTKMMNIVVYFVAWVFDPPIARYIPRCYAAGLMIYIGLSMFVEFAWSIRQRVTHQDYVLILITIVLINVLGINTGLILSILASVLLFTVLYSTVPIAERVFTRPSTLNRVSTERKQLSRLRGSIMMFKIHGYMFFGSASQLLSIVRREVAEDIKEGKRPRFVFFDGRRLEGIDSSAVVELSRLQRWIQSHNLKLVFSDLREDLFRFLQRQGLIPLDPNDVTRAKRRKAAHILSFQDVDQGLEWCEHHLLHPDFHDPHMPLFSDFTTPQQHRRSQPASSDLDSNKIEALKHAFNSLSETITDEQAEAFCPYFDLAVEHPSFVYADPSVFAKDMHLLVHGVVHIYVTEQQYSAELYRTYSRVTDNNTNEDENADEAVIPVLARNRKRRIATLVDGGIIGSVGIVLGELNSYLAVAATECVTLRISQQRLNEMKDERPDLSNVTQRLLLKSMALHIKDNYLTWMQEDMSLDRSEDERSITSSVRRGLRAIRGVMPRNSISDIRDVPSNPSSS